jgi:hypothetical protein
VCDVETSKLRQLKPAVGCSYRDSYRNRDRVRRYLCLSSRNIVEITTSKTIDALRD